ncbi:MAG: toll/interleukin-1 receptor domain-containing protein, partial [Oscillospiraceae bacterium]|nr:toll/interleukin-1 receptor domain-containing protein [Oscillospiraceae bacterium]
MAVKSVEPYTGSEPYIFISYAHADKEQVYPILEEIGKLGYRLWWDEALVATEQWKAVISRHLKQAAIMVLFV